jgi:hypothetical protein
MAIVKASYTKLGKAAKASIRYIQHRPGRDNRQLSRVLFGTDGAMGRRDAYRLIDDAGKGSLFFRFVISPDPHIEDSEKDLYLRVVTEQTMQALENRLNAPVTWVGAVHDDHTDIRHVHIVAVVSGRLKPRDFAELRLAATDACLEQRRHLDLMRQQQTHSRQEGIGLDISYDI